MKEITFDSNFGQFNYRITAMVGDEVNEQSTNLCIRGLADTGFRGVASEVEKALVKGGFATKETKRSEIEYSEEASAVIQTTAQSKLDEIATKANLPEMTFEVTGKHEYGDQEQSRVMATAMWAQVKDNDALRASLGADEDTTDEAGIELAHKFLGGLRKPRTAKK
jgi:hypothetical protein